MRQQVVGAKDLADAKNFNIQVLLVDSHLVVVNEGRPFQSSNVSPRGPRVVDEIVRVQVAANILRRGSLGLDIIAQHKYLAQPPRQHGIEAQQRRRIVLNEGVGELKESKLIKNDPFFKDPREAMKQALEWCLWWGASTQI